MKKQVIRLTEGDLHRIIKEKPIRRNTNAYFIYGMEKFVSERYGRGV